MAPGGVGNVYALDLRFEGETLLADLDEVRPTAEAVEDLDLYLRWDTPSTNASACSLLQGVAQVELPLGYVKHPTGKGISISASRGGYFWDHILEKHGSALILILPQGYTFSSDYSPPIRCDAPGYVRLSAKEFKGRIAILFIIEPYPPVRNLKTRWHMTRLGGSLSAEVQRINSLAPQPPLAPPRLPFYKRGVFWLATGIVCLFAVGLYAYHLHCPSVRVPASHFVKQKQNRKLIIFVHGVMGDMDNTWVNAKTGASWPSMIAKDDDLAAYDVYVYGYRSPCEGNSSNITELATRFGQQLKDEGFFTNYEEVYFITHSMGGLITKRVLSSLNTPSEFDKLQRVRGLLLMAVPTGGADVASVASWLSSNPQFKNMDARESQAYLQSIEQDWVNVVRNRTVEHPFPRNFVAYETLGVGELKIVPALYTSQTSDLPPMPFDYDHIDIVKPDSTENDVYKWAKKRILESSSYAISAAGKPEKGKELPKQSSNVAAYIHDNSDSTFDDFKVGAGSVVIQNNERSKFLNFSIGRAPEGAERPIYEEWIANVRKHAGSRKLIQLDFDNLRAHLAPLRAQDTDYKKALDAKSLDEIEHAYMSVADDREKIFDLLSTTRITRANPQRPQ